MNLRQLKKKIRKAAGCSTATGFRWQANGSMFGVVFKVNDYLYYYRLKGPRTLFYRPDFFGGRVRSLGYCGA